jgi:hypothetical protein
MVMTVSGEVTYKTHILVGMRPNGVMSVIADWPQVPTQADVMAEIRDVSDGYVTFALCTPTSIIPAGGNGGASDPWYKHGS